MGQPDNKVAIVTGGAPITASSAYPALISTGTEEAGLWLWQGEAPSSLSFRRPKSRIQQILSARMPASRRAGWIALPTGLALTLLAITVMPHLAPPHRPASADTPAVAPSPVPSPAVARPGVAVPQAELTEAQTDQVLVPLPPAAKVKARGPEPRMAERHVQRKFLRETRKTHASHIRSGPPIPKPGLLTPPTTWHDGY